jgi:hypothetical protein
MLIGTDSTAESTEVFEFVKGVKAACLERADAKAAWGTLPLSGILWRQTERESQW